MIRPNTATTGANTNHRRKRLDYSIFICDFNLSLLIYTAAPMRMCAHLFSTFATTFLFSPFVEECTCRGLGLEESGSRHETMNHVKRTGDEMQIRVADNDIIIESHHRNSHMV